MFVDLLVNMLFANILLVNMFVDLLVNMFLGEYFVGE